MNIKCFITLTPCVNVLKLFFFVTYEWAKEAEVFVSGRPLQPNLTFVCKARILFRGYHLILGSNFIHLK
jgi:hypothetical protein